ncbi:MAG: AbrB/MazE/SpoVT family DNA-binding domain-containing protein [Patescibacteria group bacterium]|nr:AbrB/MazE/SpoVT family DNA-binding domain-containing protein [Patescibacteria group bacterium]
MINKNENFCDCCKVEAVVSVDERGQMVLPKELRDKASIKAGEKMAVVSLRNNEKIYCLAMIKAEEISGMVKTLLGPLAKDLIK